MTGEMEPKVIRMCKQCGEVMLAPLEIENKLFMFCSLKCKNLWDQARQYYIRSSKEKEDGY
jgi:endogenous inhibitor of DNA gyrase (YacG/DUF329 family)